MKKSNDKTNTEINGNHVTINSVSERLILCVKVPTTIISIEAINKRKYPNFRHFNNITYDAIAIALHRIEV